MPAHKQRRGSHEEKVETHGDESQVRESEKDKCDARLRVRRNRRAHDEEENEGDVVDDHVLHVRVGVDHVADRRVVQSRGALLASQHPHAVPAVHQLDDHAVVQRREERVERRSEKATLTTHDKQYPIRRPAKCPRNEELGMRSFVKRRRRKGYTLMRMLLVTPSPLPNVTAVHGIVNTIDGMRTPNTLITSCGSEHAQKLIQAKSTHEYPIPHVFFVLLITPVSSAHLALNDRSTKGDRTIMRICEATANHSDRLRVRGRKRRY